MTERSIMGGCKISHSQFGFLASPLPKRTYQWLLIALISVCIGPLHADPLGVQLSGVSLLTDPIPKDTLWFNGDPDGKNSFVNQNNSQYDQVMYNSFTASDTWGVHSVWSDDIFFSFGSSGPFSINPPQSTNASWEIRSDAGGKPGDLIADGDSQATLTATGYTLLGPQGQQYTEYMVEVTGLNVDLHQGSYYLAVTPDNTAGGYAGSDTTSGDGAIGNPGGNGPAFYSTDSGSSFSPSSANTSAGIAGLAGEDLPEPSPIPVTLTGVFLLSLVAATRRKSATHSASSERQ